MWTNTNLLIALASLQSITAHDGHHHHHHHHRELNEYNDWCGTRDVRPEKVLEAEQTANEWLEFNGPGVQEQKIIIETYWHSICTASGDGGITDQMIEDSMDVLNQAYSGSGFAFQLKGKTVSDNDAWYNLNPQTDQFNELAMKSLTRTGNKATLNIWSIGNLGARILGFATFPFEYQDNPTYDGVVIGTQTAPGGTQSPYNEGDTLVHEVGHWMGLFHTFQGGCSGGDFVADTPPQAEPAFGCPFGQDTCPAAGVDNIFNYMDYTDDDCMFLFTTGQTQRMQTFWNTYRASGQDPSAPNAPTAPNPAPITPVALPTTSSSPSAVPTISSNPTVTLSNAPSRMPSNVPSQLPSFVPSNTPTGIPSRSPSLRPSVQPSVSPSSIPSVSLMPSSNPSRSPTVVPTATPSAMPSTLITACLSATELALGSVVSGSTIGTPPIDLCGSPDEIEERPGLVYSIQGNGGDVTASLCSSNTDFDTVISIGRVAGNCEKVACILSNDDASNDDACGSASQITFPTTVFETYLIYVQGFFGSTGSFELSVTSDYVPPSPTPVPTIAPEPTPRPTLFNPPPTAPAPTCEGFGFGAIGNLVNGAVGFLGF